MFEYPNLLRDALYNLAYDSGPDPEHAKGVLVGLVSVLMAQGQTFETAMRTLKPYLPLERLVDPRRFPPMWQEYLYDPDGWFDPRYRK